MIDIRQLRENPARFALGAKEKGIKVDIEALVQLDADRRAAQQEIERLRSEQNRLAKESGPQIGKLKGQLKGKHGPEADAIQKEIEALSAKPAALKAAVHELEQRVQVLEPKITDLLLQVPLPPDADVPRGSSSDDNIEIRRWNPPGFDAAKPFEQQKGFKPRTHIELVRDLKLADFERGVKLAGSRSYVLTGDGMALHMAVLRYAFDFMSQKKGFTPVSVPVVVREECMVGTGFFPAGREQAYHIEESKRGGGYDLFLTGTGEVGLMGLYGDEILDEAALPIRMVTVSTCFRREAGARARTPRACTASTSSTRSSRWSSARPMRPRAGPGTRR